MAGPLQGLKVVEMAGLGPAPFCAMMLADMGADVVRIERPGAPSVTGAAGKFDVTARSRRVLALDLKNPLATGAVLALVEQADVLIEGFRPASWNAWAWARKRAWHAGLRWSTAA